MMRVESFVLILRSNQKASMLQDENFIAEQEHKRSSAIKVIKVLLFSASIVPALMGGAMAYAAGAFSWLHFTIVTLALFIGQAGGDYLYYYFTHQHTDSRDSHTKIFAGWRPFFAETYIRGKGIMVLGFLLLIIDLAIGVYYAIELGYIILVLAGVAGLIAIFFTPLMLRGYKEIVIFITFGPLIMFGIYYVLVQEISIEPLVAAIPIGFLVTVVAYLKGAHFTIREGDSKEVELDLTSKKISLLFALGYLGLLGGVIGGVLPVWTLLGLISLPLAFGVIRVLNKKTSYIPEYLWAVVKSIVILILTGIGMTAGYLIA